MDELENSVIFQRRELPVIVKDLSRCQFHQHVRAGFLDKSISCSFSAFIFCQKNIGAKAARNTLVKLTAG